MTLPQLGGSAFCVSTFAIPKQCCRSLDRILVVWPTHRYQTAPLPHLKNVANQTLARIFFSANWRG